VQKKNDDNDILSSLQPMGCREHPACEIEGTSLWTLAGVR
jgi:hypothetical protein